MKIIGVFAALLGLYGVITGAVAEHVIQDAHASDMVKMAAFYGLLHAAVLLGWNASGYMALAAKIFLIVGVFLFSGSITLKYVGHFIAPLNLAPIGGGILILGWLFILIIYIKEIIVSLYRHSLKNKSSNA
ncbi:MAG: DUF423 domain-containing protein [Candidatus Berkiella sp.]